MGYDSWNYIILYWESDLSYLQTVTNDTIRRITRYAQRLGERHHSDVGLQKVPDALRDELVRGSSSNSPDGRIRIGLEKDFILLDQLGDPIGKLWAEKRNKVKDVLQVRNFSILAHGDKPVTEVEYRQCEILAEFVSSAISRCKLKINWTQLPGEELVDL